MQVESGTLQRQAHRPGARRAGAGATAPSARRRPADLVCSRLGALALSAAAALVAVTAPAPAAGTSGPVVVTGRTDRRQVTIGTPFRYIVEVRAPRDAELLIPIVGGELGEFSVVDFGEEPVREDGDQVVATRWYSLVAYRPGYLLIPGLPVQYRIGGGELERVDGEDVAIVVASLLEREPDAADIRDIKGPVAVPFDWTPVAAAGAVAVVAAGLAFVGSRLLRRISAPPAAAPPRPPDVEALEALARLRERRLTEPEDRTRWYVDLSAIVRAYIEGRFGLRAPEMTTEEFIHSVQRDSPLGAGHRELLGAFLAECDLVKFARYVPDARAAERAYECARSFVVETRPAPPQTAEREGRRAA